MSDFLPRDNFEDRRIFDSADKSLRLIAKVAYCTQSLIKREDYVKLRNSSIPHILNYAVAQSLNRAGAGQDRTKVLGLKYPLGS